MPISLLFLPAQLLSQVQASAFVMTTSESAAMRDALKILLQESKLKNDRSCLISTTSFIEGLLSESDGEDIKIESQQKCDMIQSRNLYEELRGVPQRPFYHELSKRVLTISQYKNKISTQSNGSNNAAATQPFLPASHFGVTELQCINTLVPEPPHPMASVEEWVKWLQNAGESGIFATLGLRRTIGSVSMPFDSDNNVSKKQYLFPPTLSQLLESSRRLHKPNTKSSLTVAARALAKHAHRGSENYFGTVSGSEAHKNEHADVVLQKLLREAAWINIHAFGGVDEERPVMEVRTVEGYGARWSAIWRHNAFSPQKVQFRGFLEPHFEDGHQNRWRH